MLSAESTPVEPPLPRGFEALYLDHYDFAWRCALRLGVAPSDVEDIVQETFIVALRRYDPRGFEGPGAAQPSTWLFAILHNVLRNHARSERRRRARLALLAEAEPTRPTMRAERTLGLRLLDEFLAELDVDRRAVFVLTEIEGMRGPEIARALGVNANTVRSRLRAARRAFERRFGTEGAPLVERAADEEAPPEARARTMAVIGLPLVSLAPTAKSSVGGLSGSLGGGVLGGAIGALVLVGAVVIAGGSSREQPRRSAEEAQPVAGHASPPSSARAIEATEPTEPDDAAAEPIDALRAEARRPARSTTRRPQQPEADPERVARERLARARRALLDGDASTALSLVESSAGWPATLDVHRVALEIGALCRLDRAKQARARAEAWRRAHPDTQSAISLRGVCWDDDNASSVGGHQAP